MATVTVHVPRLRAVGHKADDYPAKVSSAKRKVANANADITGTSGLASLKNLRTVEEVWTSHLRKFHTDLDSVSSSLVATANTYHAGDTATVDYFQAISPEDQRHHGIRP